MPDSATIAAPAATTLSDQPIARVRRGDVEYVLLGTAHVSRASADAVRAILERESFDAVANGLPLLACNRTGFEAAPEGGRGIQFWGSSFVAGPQGEFIAKAGIEGRELLLADIDLARSENVRRIWPFLRDRRIDAYDDLLKRFRD